MVNNIIVVSDPHCGCRMGLCPPGKHQLDDGGTYEPSPLQLKVWDWHSEFWDEWVKKVTRGEPYAVLINGDTTDGVHHGTKTQISQNLVDQRRIAQRIYEPIVERCAKDKKGKPLFFMTRGTEAHVGASAENEETLGEILGAQQDDAGNYTQWKLWMRIGGKKGALVHFLHTVGSTGSMYYESTAPMKELVESFSEAGRWNDQAPDIVVRSHRHRYIKIEVPTEKGYGIVIVTPCWQLPTPLTYRIASARVSLPQFGGILIRQGDEEHYTRSWVRNITRPKEVVI